MAPAVTPVASPPKPVAETVTTNEAAAATPKTRGKPKQETLPLEGVSRGRFDKSEPTLYNGEDLDVPTFIRRGVSLKR
jgi:cell division protein FtsZ